MIDSTNSVTGVILTMETLEKAPSEEPSPPTPDTLKATVRLSGKAAEPGSVTLPVTAIRASDASASEKMFCGSVQFSFWKSYAR